MRYAEIVGAKKPRRTKSKPTRKLDTAALKVVGLDPDKVVAESGGTPSLPCGPIVKHPMSMFDWAATLYSALWRYLESLGWADDDGITDAGRQAIERGGGHATSNGASLVNRDSDSLQSAKPLLYLRSRKGKT